MSIMKVKYYLYYTCDMVDAIGMALAYLLTFIFMKIDLKNVWCKQSHESG